MKKGKLIAVILCLGMLFALVAACGGDDANVSSGPEATGGTSATGGGPGGGTDGPSGGANAGRDSLSIAVIGDNGSLNWAAISGDFQAMNHLVMEPMWTVRLLPGEGHELEFILAESVDVLEDNGETYWIINLRQGVTFSNGNPFTASDVIFTINQAREVGIFGISRTQEIDIDRTSIIDEYTIEMRFLRYRFNQFEIYSDLLIYDEESFDLDRAAVDPIGTGPYRVTEYVVNSHVFMERRDDYWGEPAAIRQFQFRTVAEPAQIVNGLATNNLDIAIIPNLDVDYVSGLSGINVLERYAGRWISVGMNPTVGHLFHDVEARYAVIHAINSQAIIDVVYNGQGEIMKGPVSRACWDFHPDFENRHDAYTIGYDLDLAKMYAERSGIAGSEVRIITGGQQAHVQIAEMLQMMLREIGLNLTIHNYDAAGFGDARNDSSMWEMTIEGGWTPTLVYMAGIVDVSRMNNVYSQEDAWPECEWWNSDAPLVYSILDPAARHERALYMLDVWARNSIVHSIVETAQFYALPEGLTNVYFGQHNFPMYRYLRFE